MSQEPVDYRRSFLAKHLHQELQETGRSDILAVEDLLLEAKAAGVPRENVELRKAVNRRRFFYENTPEFGLYLPLRVKVAEGKEYFRHATDLASEQFKRLAYAEEAQARRAQALTAPPVPTAVEFSTHRDLTELMRIMNQRLHDPRDPDRRGIVLISNSGGGKSTAARKALFDCFYNTNSEDEVRLAGFLPCWLRVSQPPAGTGKAIIEKMLVELCDPTGNAGSQIERWLKSGPPLLIFLDLNAVDDKAHALVAEALGHFQTEYGYYGHRCVITYRSVNSDAPALVKLRAAGKNAFGFYELLPYGKSEKNRYLQSYNSFRQQVFSQELKTYQIPCPWRDVEQDCQLVDQLSDRLRTQGESSVIDLPLLTHFAAGLSSKGNPIETLYDLYRNVVKRYIKREKEEYGNRLAGYYWNRLTPDDPPLDVQHFPWLAKTLMTRFALAVISLGNTATRLEHQDWHTLLVKPQRQRTNGQIGPWVPDSSFWHAGSYFKEACQKRETGPWAEFSLLSQQGSSYGFLHDSFLYYFAGAVALVEYEDPGEVAPLNQAWRDELIQRIGKAPEQWVLPARFLAGRLHAIDRATGKLGLDSDAAQVLIELIVAADSPSWYNVIRNFAIELPFTPLLKAVATAVNAVSSGLNYYWDQPYARIVAHLRLSDPEDAPCCAYADRIEQRFRERYWT